MGRRKTSVARVRLFPAGNGDITINGKNARSYFGQRDALLAVIAAPFRAVELENTYNMSIRVVGGG
ncbi:MAG TPA: 30S ribosomal protein S9, partial [Ktedonobacter sp.]|nr:30S ribosomal protein S9 [Ktedonobacter sp.]